MFLEAEPEAAKLLRPFVGAREYLQGSERWILALHDASPTVLARLPHVRERIAAVRAYRADRKSKPTQQLAETPTVYHVNVRPTAPFLVIPEVSSERREYLPVGWLEPLAQAVLDARAAHSGATLANLYDPDLMPPNLRRAHHALDRAVDRFYRRQRFTSERERVEHLFMLYEKMRAPLAAVMKTKPKRRRRRRKSPQGVV